MEIIVLGTGYCAGIPQIGCLNPKYKRCRVCKLALENKNRDKRTRSSVLIKNGDKFTLIDATPDLRQQLIREKIAIQQIPEVLVTHTHLDHILGLFEISAGLLDPDIPDTQREIKIYSAEEINNKLKELIGCFEEVLGMKTKLRDFKELKIGEKNIVNKLTVFPFKVPHTFGKFGPTLGFRISEKGKIFVYIPCIGPDKNNTREISDEVIDNVKNSDCIFLGAPFYEKSKSAHIAFLILKEILKNLRIRKKVYFTNLSHNLERTREELEKVAKPFNVAYDGMKIEL